MIIRCKNCHKAHDIIVNGEEFIPDTNEYFTNDMTELARYDTQIATRVMHNDKECLHYKCIDCNSYNIIEIKKELL